MKIKNAISLKKHKKSYIIEEYNTIIFIIIIIIVIIIIILPKNTVESWLLKFFLFNLTWKPRIEENNS